MGTTHCNADALSRRPCSEDCKHCSRLEEKACFRESDDRWEPEELLRKQRNDPKRFIMLEEFFKRKFKSVLGSIDSMRLEDGFWKRVLESNVGTKTIFDAENSSTAIFTAFV